MEMKLTTKACDAAVTTNKLRKLSDGGGLQLWVTPPNKDGRCGKSWRYAYRFDGKQKCITIGPYPLFSLKEAREAMAGAKKQVIQGIDPSALKKERKRQQRIEEATFKYIAEEYLEKLRREGRAEATLKKNEWMLGLAYPDLGDREIAGIKPAEILTCLRRVEAKGNYETARRLRSTIGSVCRYAIATARLENDPTYALQGALITPKVTPRAAITDPEKLGNLLRVVEDYTGHITTRTAIILMAHLFPRPGELRQAEWAGIDFKNRVWTIPAERTKMRRPHKVPLSHPVLKILRDLHIATGFGRYLFHSVRSIKRPLSEPAMNAALRTMGFTKDEVTAHGFRATASTLLNESGKWNPDAIERQLAHVEGNDVRCAYARGEHWDERVEMMEWWSEYLEELKANG